MMMDEFMTVYLFGMSVSGILIGIFHGLLDYDGLFNWIKTRIKSNPIMSSIVFVFTFPFLSFYTLFWGLSNLYD